MKKLVSLFLVCIVLCSCNYDPYSGRRPYDYDDSLWVCEEPPAWFEVRNDTLHYDEPRGELTIGEEVLTYDVFFVHQTNIVYLRLGDGRKLEGECEFLPGKMIINADKNADTIFNGQYDELVFVRKRLVTTE